MSSPLDLGELQPIYDALKAAADITQSHEALADFTSSGPITNAPDTTLADIVASLNAAAAGPSAEVKAGKTPMPQNVGILPGYDKEKALENYQHLVDMSSIVALYTAIWNANARTQRGHPEPYNITVPSEAALEFADQANSAYQVMTGPLGGLFNLASEVATTYNKEMSKTTVHLEFLAELFKGFNLGKAALTQLDGILTNFVSSLGTVNVETGSTKNTVDQTLRINQVLRINISGDDSDPIWVFQPRTRIVYMKINASTWRWATNKADHTSSTFTMNYVVVDLDLNVSKYLSSKPKLDAVFQKVTGKTMKAFGKMINPTPVQANS